MTDSEIIPRYVRNRNDFASRVGLRATVERGQGERESEYIVSCWRGTSDQFRATATLPRSLGFDFKRYRRICSYGEEACITRTGRDSFALRLYDPIPAIVHQESSIEVLEVERWENHVEDWYHGSYGDLLAAGLMTEKQLPPTSTKRHLKRKDGMLQDKRSWWSRREPDGMLLFGITRNPSSAPDRNLSSYKSPDEFREWLEDLIVLATGLIKEKGQVETRRGYRYTLDRAALQEVINAIEVAAQGLRNVPVKVEKLVTEEAQATARESSARASNDANFQRFIDRLLHNGEHPQE